MSVSPEGKVRHMVKRQRVEHWGKTEILRWAGLVGGGGSDGHMTQQLSRLSKSKLTGRKILNLEHKSHESLQTFFEPLKMTRMELRSLKKMISTLRMMNESEYGCLILDKGSLKSRKIRKILLVFCMQIDDIMDILWDYIMAVHCDVVRLPRVTNVTELKLFDSFVKNAFVDSMDHSTGLFRDVDFIYEHSEWQIQIQLKRYAYLGQRSRIHRFVHRPLCQVLFDDSSGSSFASSLKSKLLSKIEWEHFLDHSVDQYGIKLRVKWDEYIEHSD